VSATGVFEYNEREHLLTFSIITGQSDGDLTTTSDVYLVNTVSKKYKCLKKSLGNSVNAFFSINGESLFYLNDSLLYKYSIVDFTEKPVMKIINEKQYILLDFNIVTDSSFNILYVRNPSLDGADISDDKIYKIQVGLKNPIFQ
jgi:hypothetical protein